MTTYLGAAKRAATPARRRNRPANPSPQISVSAGLVKPTRRRNRPANPSSQISVSAGLIKPARRRKRPANPTSQISVSGGLIQGTQRRTRAARPARQSVSAGKIRRQRTATRAGDRARGAYAESASAAQSQLGAVPPHHPRAHRPLRIIAVFPNLVRGGAEQWLLYLAKFLDPRRARLVRCIVANRRTSDPDFAAELPVPVEYQRRDSLRRAVRNCDVLVVFGLACDSLLGKERARLCVFIAHGEGGWTTGLLASSRARCDHVVAVSQRVAETVCDGFPTTVIYNGVDTARLAQTQPREEVRRRFGFHAGDFVLGYIGRFSAEKRPELLIRAVRELPPCYKLLLVGWGADRAKLMSLANRLIPGRFAFAAASNYLGDYYRAMDAFGLVSNQEGFSLALLEAMMCELPVIVTSVGSVPEIIVDRVSGVIVQGIPAAIARGVERLAQYPAWARGVAAEGHRFALRHGNAARMARDYETLLARLWSEKYGPRA